MKRTVTFRSVLLAALMLLFGSQIFAQPEGDYMAIVGGSGDVKQVMLFDFEDGTLAYETFLDMSVYDVGTLKHVIRVGDEFWVSDQTKDRIHRLDIDGNLLGQVGDAGGLDNVRGMRIIGDQVWLANAGTQNGAPGNTAVQISMTGEILGSFPVTGSPWSFWPYGADNVLISFSNATGFSSQIAEFTQTGTYLGAWNNPGEINFIQQITPMQNGNYLATSFSTGSYSSGVHEYDPNGTYLGTIGGTSGAGVRGAWELGNGNVIWTNGNGIHIANTAAGTSSQIYTGSYHYVEKITFAPGTGQLPFAEDFESGAFPDGWEVYDADGVGEQWVVADEQNHTPGGAYSAFHDFGLMGMEDGWLVTPAIEFPEFWEIELSFWSYNDWPVDYDKNSILISTGDGNPANGDFVEIWTAASVVEDWEQTFVDLSDYAGNMVYLAFRYEGDDAHGWHLDDILIDGGLPELDPPTNLEAIVAVNDVILTWDAPVTEELLGYNVYRDEVLITPSPITETTYTDLVVPAGTHLYGVSAVYDSGESGKAGPVQVYVEGTVGKIHGFVRDAVTNLVIDEAMITASDADNGVMTFMTPFGSYYSLLLPPGTYDLTCTAEGYQPFTLENAVVLENMNKAYTFYLQPAVGDLLTGINPANQSGFSVYPNPASGQVMISAKGLKEVQIVNQAGMVVYQKQLSDNTIRIDLDNIPSGMYFIKVLTNNGMDVQKLIVN
jgi:hypothetical protein